MNVEYPLLTADMCKQILYKETNLNLCKRTTRVCLLTWVMDVVNCI